MSRTHIALCVSLLCAACAARGSSAKVASATGAESPPPARTVHPPSEVVPLVGLLPAMPEPVTSFGAASDGQALYTFGGYSGEPHVYSREGQSPALARLALDGASPWETLAQIDKGLQGVALVAHAGKVCRVGGTEARNAAGTKADLHSVSEAACYDLAQRRWLDLPALPAGRSSHEAAVIGSTLYVAGGWTLQGEPGNGTFHTDLIALDLDRPQAGWSAVPAPFKRRALGVAAARGKLVIVGGLSPEGEPSKQVDIYDPAARAWSRGPDFPDNAFGVAVESAGDAIVASAQSGVVYRWKLGDAAWQPLTRLTFARFFHQLVASGPDEIIAVGGISGMHNEGRTKHVERVSLSSAAPRIVAWSMAYPGQAKNRQGVFVHEDAVYLFGGNNSLEQHDFEPHNFVDQTFKLNLASLRISELEPFPARRQTMQTVSRERDGIAIGGFGHDGTKAVSFADAYAFDFETERWRPTAGLPASRTQFGLAQHGEELWIFGGLNYDPARGDSAAFQHVTDVLRAPREGVAFADAQVSLPGPRRAFAGAVSGDEYFLVGGMRGEFQLVEDCLRYSFKTQSFGALACPDAPRLSGALVPVRDRLYLAGGSVRAEGGLVSAQELVELDPATNTWRSVVAALPFDTRHMHALALGDRVLLLSTHNADGRMNVAIIDPLPTKPAALVARAGGQQR